ncbi:outer membrane beta-barrel protein [Bradyrhizobium sediminis]|uniref:Outer membrane beta-barrel protein n=1 Tax=Bradyrhizobium sediminis TaxID=2840469 RepID=A0A975NW81_9BRAD|nr:outer membrane beta-barrel protein [Bradyrhizobium sediminis]QWG22532.1 outer membrane beta-barrel protein [Bradyrhizobium sediminis]
MKQMATAILTVACIVALGQAANAADVARPAYKVASAPVANWSGIYAGFHAGWGQTSGDPGAASLSTTGYASPVFETPNLNLKGNGPLFGGQLGFNWQINPSWVIGAEGDITGTGLKSSATGTPNCLPPFCGLLAPVPGASQYMAQDINWLASLRGRLGYSWGSSLFYVTGGAAWANISYRADSADATWVCNGGGGGGAGCSYPASFDSTKTGWAVGAGYEAMITANWSLRAEYLYYSFGGTTASAAGTPAAACQVADCSATYIFSATDIHTARVGVNYRF